MLIDMVLSLQPYISGIPTGKDQAWSAATRNDGITVKSWGKQWIDQTVINKKDHDFEEFSVMGLHGKFAGKPCILAGAGPSLEKNWKDLIGDGDKSRGRKDIPIITNVHNFPFMEDRDLMKSSDYYLILDAGEICIKEMSEGGSHDEEWYWDRTKDRTLIAYHATHPYFVKKWRGPIYWFTTPPASPEIGDAMCKLIDYQKIPGFNVGGNVMGACLYFARAILGCSVPIWIGMDLCFSYNRKFHPWDCWYNEKFQGVMPWTDIYGNRVFTWGSYFGFKNWFDYMACGGTGNNAQLWINATEGGIMGAYPDGNIQQIIQLDLKTALHMFNMYTIMPEMIDKSVKGQLHLLF
jgi:hypothetical protein